MRKVTQEKIKTMIELFNQNKTNIEIGKVVGVTADVVSRYLKENGCIRKNLYNLLTEDERKNIAQLYMEDKWDEIFSRYPHFTKQSVYYLCGKMGEKKESYFWSNEDVELLKKNFGASYSELEKMMNGRHSKKAISTKAIKLGLTTPQEWTPEEIDILTKYYSILPKNEMLKKLPSRTFNAMVCKAKQLNLLSYKCLQERYTDEEKSFIIKNSFIMTDKEMAIALNRPLHGISNQRRKLGICYCNKQYAKYVNFNKFFRGHIQDWKNKSMKSCNYQCIITGSKDYVIHHLYGFNLIVQEVFDKMSTMNLLKTDNLQDYTKEELDVVLQIFDYIHEKYPLGICLSRPIHDLFHKIYGTGGNTERQWRKFYNNLILHKYDAELAA